MITKDGRNTQIADLTPENYIVPAGEEKSYHCIVEVVQFDQKTGKRISKPRVQKFGKKIFENVVFDSLKKQGYSVTILHNPTEWMKANAAKIAESRKAAAESQEKAIQDRIDAAVAKALAEQGKAKGRKTKEE